MIRYGHVIPLPGTSFEDAIRLTTEALAREGFGILTQIDVRATLAKKLGADFRPYTILGACNPSLAHRAIIGEPHVGLLLPCNVVVQETAPGGVEVSLASPRAMFEPVGNLALGDLVNEADQRIAAVAEHLRQAAPAPNVG